MDMDLWYLRVKVIQQEGENVVTTSKKISFKDNQKTINSIKDPEIFLV